MAASTGSTLDKATPAAAPSIAKVDERGIDLLVKLLHEAVHSLAGGKVRCLYAGLGHDPVECPRMTEDVRAVLLETVESVDVLDLFEPLRLTVPELVQDEQVLILPFVNEGENAGALVLCGEIPRISMASLRRLQDLAARGLHQVGEHHALLEDMRAQASQLAQCHRDLTRAAASLALQERLMSQTSTEALVRVLAVELGGDVLVQSPNLLVVEASGLDARALALGTSRRGDARTLVDQITASAVPVVIPAQGKMPMRVAAAIRNSDELLGFVVAAIDPTEKEQGLRALRDSASLLRYQLSIVRSAERSAAALRQGLLSDLLAGRVSEGVLNQAAQMGHELTASHVCFALAPRSGDTDLSRIVQLVDGACRQSSLAASASLVGTFNGKVFAFVPEPLTASALSVAQKLAADTTLGSTLVVGIGPTASTPECFAETARSAAWTADVLLHGQMRGRVAHFDDLGIYGLLFDHGHKDALTGFVQRWLGPLQTYDLNHGGELLATLSQYFKQGSLINAAEALHIHISTLKYRMKRIQEVLDVDLADQETAFNLSLAVRMQESLRHVTAVSEVWAEEA